MTPALLLVPVMLKTARMWPHAAVALTTVRHGQPPVAD